MDYETYYNLEIEKISENILKNDFKKIILQFPDGLKQFSNQVVDKLEKLTKKVNCDFFIYFGTCFGACDIPLHLKELNFDLCVQFGHNIYIKKKDIW
jgi:2-(3-amino-3-carboxypropyl)histidine synthase